MRTALGISSLFDGSQTDLTEPQQFRYISEDRSIVLNINLFVLMLLGVSAALLVLKMMIISKKIAYKQYIRKAKKVMAQTSFSKSKKEQVKTEIEETKFELKDEIYHCFQRV
jgi:uncharacterized membrane protein YgaE (UPF0421/DUF939 family)